MLNLRQDNGALVTFCSQQHRESWKLGTTYIGPATTEDATMLDPGACASCAWCGRLLTPAVDECARHDGDCPAWDGLGTLNAVKALERVLENFELDVLPPAGWVVLAAAADTLAAAGQLKVRALEDAMFVDRGLPRPSPREPRGHRQRSGG